MKRQFTPEELKEVRIPEERIHPDLRAFARRAPSSDISLESIKAMRGMARGMPKIRPPRSTDSITVWERLIPGPQGAPEVRVRIYDPAQKDGLIGGLVWIHGGGYVYDIMDMDDHRCARFALESECVVVSVDYRVAPENPYPAALEDCYAALTWFSQNAETFGVDRERIAVSGGSAGGGLTVGLCLLARDRGGPEIAFQMPLCPMMDDRHITPSSTAFNDKRFWALSGNVVCWDAYLGGIADDDVPIYAAPSRAKDLSNLPPAYVLVGEMDMFRDESVDYAQRLSASGITTELHVFPGCFHGFEAFTRGGISDVANDETVRVLKIALQKKQLKED